MLKPTIHAVNFPYRGLKSRGDISGVLTSARYDICRCLDQTADSEARRQAILLAFVRGSSADLTYRTAGGTIHSLNEATGQCLQIRLRATRLLFGD